MERDHVPQPGRAPREVQARGEAVKAMVTLDMEKNDGQCTYQNFTVTTRGVIAAATTRRTE